MLSAPNVCVLTLANLSPHKLVNMRGLCSAAGMSLEPQGLVGVSANNWSMSGVLGAAPGETEEAEGSSGPYTVCATRQHQQAGSSPDEQERRNRAGPPVLFLFI